MGFSKWKTPAVPTDFCFIFSDDVVEVFLKRTKY